MEEIQIISNSTTQRKNEVNILILAISAVGIGLFNYYIGRSHDFNFIEPSWPALLSVILFTDKLFSELVQASNPRSIILTAKAHLNNTPIYYKIILFVTLFCFLTSTVLSIVIHFPAYYAIISTRIANVKAGTPDTLRNDIVFIRSYTRSGDQTLILSYYAPELYLYTNTIRALPVPGFGELVLVSDANKIIDFLKMPPTNAKIFWDKGMHWEFQFKFFPKSI
jgi:hypothetical protein